MTDTPRDIRAQLERDEGKRRFPYTDSVGKVSIGIGRNLADVPLSDAAINFLFEEDLAATKAMLTAALPWYTSLDEARQGVLENLSFDLRHRLIGFHNMLSAMENKDWAGAAAQLLDSLFAKQVGDRAKRLARQLETGQWI